MSLGHGSCASSSSRGPMGGQGATAFSPLAVDGSPGCVPAWLRCALLDKRAGFAQMFPLGTVEIRPTGFASPHAVIASASHRGRVSARRAKANIGGSHYRDIAAQGTVEEPSILRPVGFVGRK